MKLKVFVIGLAVAGIGLFASCSGGAKKDAAEQKVAKEQYKCPMNCTEEVFDQPGKCPVCGMDLEKMEQG